MKLFSFKSFSKASRGAGSSMPSTCGSGIEAFSGVVMLLATAMFHGLTARPALPPAQQTTTVVVVQPTPTPTVPLNLTPTKSIPAATPSFPAADSPFSFDMFKVLGVVGAVGTLAGTVVFVRRTASTPAENSSETSMPSENGSGSAEDEDSMDSDASDESDYGSDEDLSWLFEDSDDSDDGSDDSSDPDTDDIDTDTDPGSEGEPAEDERRGSADPEDPPPPPPGSTTASDPDDIPSPAEVYDPFAWFLIFTAVCVSAIEEYWYRPREGRRTQRRAEIRNGIASEEGLGNTTATTILPCRKEINTVTKSLSLWVKPATDLVPEVAPYTPWLAERILSRVAAPIPTPAVFSNQTSSVLMSNTANATTTPANVTISPAHAAAEYVRSIGDRIRDASATEMYWGAIIAFGVIHVVWLLRADWSVEQYEKKEVGVRLESLEPMKEEKVKKKKKKNRKGKKKKVRGVEEEGAEIDATVEQEKEEVEQKEGDVEETNEIDVTDEREGEFEQEKGNTEIKENEIEEEECENARVENIAEGEMEGDADKDEAMSDIGEFEDALEEMIVTPTVPFADEESTAVIDETALNTEVEDINTPVESSETAIEEAEQVGNVLKADKPIESASRKQSENGQDSATTLPLTERSPIPAEDAPLPTPVEPKTAAEPGQSTSVNPEPKPEPGWHVVSRRARKQKPEAVQEIVPQLEPEAPTPNKEAEAAKEQRKKEAIESWKAFQEEKAREAEERAAEAKMAKGKGKRSISSFEKVMKTIREQRAALMVELKGDTKEEVNCLSEQEVNHEKEPSCAPLSSSTSVLSDKSEAQNVNEVAVTQPAIVPSSSKLPPSWAAIAGGPAGSDNAVVTIPTISIPIKKNEVENKVRISRRRR